MAKKVPSRSNIILSATKYATQADIPALHALISHYKISSDLFLRILLSYLPECLESSCYTSLLKYLVFSQNTPSPESFVDATTLDKICEEDDERLAKKLHLLPLAWPRTACDIATDSFSTFLIHRCLRIDEGTGLIIEIPALLDPFFEQYSYLKKWMVSTVLPLLRLTYEYYPDDVDYISIKKFEGLESKAAIAYLLSKTGKDRSVNSNPNVGRDLRGLIGPWLCRDLSQIRLSLYQPQSSFSESLYKVHSINQIYTPWEETFLWIFSQTEASWKTAVDAIENWDGPEDYDFGSYDVEYSLKEDEMLFLKRRYIRTAMAIAYAIPEESKFALTGTHRVLVRIISLMGMDAIASLESSCTDLIPVKQLDSDIICQFSVIHLKTLMNDENPMIEPTDASIKFLHALLVSAALCDRLGCSISIKYAAIHALQKDEYLQSILFNNLMVSLKNKSKDGDELFSTVRKELLWLRSWGVKQLSNERGFESGIGILGQLSEEFIEIEFLKVLLFNARYKLAQSLYETSKYQLLSRETLCKVVLTTALNCYDSATNANISRGALKKCNDILNAFSKTLSQSLQYQKVQNLLQLTCEIEPYRLVLKKGEPFKPAILRVYEDPIIILGKILEQNPQSYKKIAEFIEMAKKMVRAGLIKNEKDYQLDESLSFDEVLEVSESRVIAMCIDAALVEDDFETAYFYVKNYFKKTTSLAHVQALANEGNMQNQVVISTGKVRNWLWRAALQAGKYRGNSEVAHINIIPDSSSRNREISHLKKRMDCISQALKLAPKETLQEILNVYRRCEEELDSLFKQSIEEEKWVSQTNDQKIPGGFVSTPSKKDVFSSSSLAKAEEPISLFDLSRAGMMRAQSGLSSFSILKGIPKNNTSITSIKQSEFSYESDESGTEISTEQKRVRKRDQLKNVAVGGLATGVGWLIGAPLPKENLNES
ncbi:Protein transport protein sec39 [Erysiphe neolycopersici]|uniref:Protein transport protein sec39 n=1 Tax=Erysiphe neolycopersici TaxID=212602 RepID=A0A420HI61_9PEZI|nr:Protein transport protein sec39 [Erysiphe neolycopersici]